jgi:biotin carboxylase
MQSTGAGPLLVVGGGFFQLDIIRTARRLGRAVAVVDRSPTAPGLALADHAVTVDTADTAAVVAAARRLGVTGVVTAASDVAVPAVAAVAEALGLVGLRPDVARVCRDKLATFERVRAAGLPVPDTLRVADLAQAEAAAATIGYPVVLKPRSAAGGRGVTVVRQAAGLPLAVARALTYAHGAEGALVQRCVDGLSVGVEAFFWRGRVVRAFVLDDAYQEGFVSPVGHALHCSLAPAEEAEVIADVARFAAALGVSDGPANLDLRRSGGRTVLIEMNARLGGNSITDLVRWAYGSDLSSATVHAALGEDPTPALAPRHANPVAARLLLCPGRGRARVRHDPAAFAGRDGVLTVDVSARDGEAIAAVVDDWSIVGRVLCAGADAHAAAAAAAALAEEVLAGIGVEP